MLKHTMNNFYTLTLVKIPQIKSSQIDGIKIYQFNGFY